ncbi:hypothetical protein KY339_00965 [Candidatus Woesearchaeota archaeon]|nr:hypothetical protein [Candidatus Woesearchaeota archaeon]
MKLTKRDGYLSISTKEATFTMFDIDKEISITAPLGTFIKFEDFEEIYSIMKDYKDLLK